MMARAYMGTPEKAVVFSNHSSMFSHDLGIGIGLPFHHVKSIYEIQEETEEYSMQYLSNQKTNQRLKIDDENLSDEFEEQREQCRFQQTGELTDLSNDQIVRSL